MRRALGGVVKIDVVAHSALLVETEMGSKHIIELLEDGKIHKTDETPGKVLYDSSKWSVQKVGATPTKSATPDKIVETMQAFVDKRGKYNLLTNNCHMAQEYARRDILGVEVADPY